jgi:copper chaperone
MVRDMKTIAVDIEGMSCDHCVRAVKNALGGIAGVVDAEVRVGHADVRANDDVARDAVIAAIEEEGYRVPGR